MILPLNKNSGWESEATVNLILSIVNLISETNKQFEVNIGGRNIKITELPNWIKLIRENIFGESQWIVNQSQSRFFRLLGEYTQVWEEIGVGDLDLEIISKIKSPDEINHFIYSITPKGSERGTILNLHADFLNQRHKNDWVFWLAYTDWLSFYEPNKYSCMVLDIDDIYDIYPRVKTFLPKMRNLKIIDFHYFEELCETIKLLGLKSLQQNGVKINFCSSNYPENHGRAFTITAGECVILHTDKEIEALNLKMKGDIEIEIFTWDFNYILNSEYLLWVWFKLNKFEIDWELIENEQKIKFPKFTKKLKHQHKLNLILIPLNRIKKVSYNVYFGRKDEVKYDIGDLTRKFDNKVCKSLDKPSSLFCLLNEETIIDICLRTVRDKYDNDLLIEFEKELKSYIPISPRIKYMKIDLFEITCKNVNLLLQLLKGWIRLNELVFKVRESDKRISQEIIDTIAKYNKWLSQIHVSINTEGAEFLHFAQISCDRNIIIRTQKSE